MERLAIIGALFVLAGLCEIGEATSCGGGCERAGPWRGR